MTKKNGSSSKVGVQHQRLCRVSKAPLVFQGEFCKTLLSRPCGRVRYVPTEARGFWSAASSIARHSKVFTAKDLDIRLVDAFPSKRGQQYFRLFAHLHFQGLIVTFHLVAGKLLHFDIPVSCIVA